MEEVSGKHRTDDAWVLVITGSGAHSQNGPIIRSAVLALLEKRKMIFTLNPGKGSFSVKANSGFKLYAPCLPSDTKVIVQQAPEPRVALPASFTGRGPRPAAPSDYSPSPAEVAANDAQFEDSKREYEKQIGLANREGRLLEKTLSMSFLEAEAEKEQEEGMLKQALSLSALEGVDQDDELQTVLDISRRDAAREQASHDEDLQKALEMSAQFSSAGVEAFHRMLEQSKLEYEHEGNVSVC
mmetsp:Transcript_124794/g.186421  ORF Transcript_124794/g.186421 Transcript_124794/m.186421 type:complete len:241 (+) Transcript_124794:268-990(+)